MQVDDSAESDCLDARANIVVSISHPAWSEALKGIETDCARAAEAALECGLRHMECALPAAEVSIVLADDSQVHDLNLRHRGRDSATDVLSFPSMTPAQLAAGGDSTLASPVLLGDIVLAFETVQKAAGEQGKSLHAHVSHLIAHGVLHLLGFDHDTQDAAAKMERLECAALRDLGIEDPYVVE